MKRIGAFGLAGLAVAAAAAAGAYAASGWNGTVKSGVNPAPEPTFGDEYRTRPASNTTCPTRLTGRSHRSYSIPVS